MNQDNQEDLYQQQLFEDRQRTVTNKQKSKAGKIIKIVEITEEIEASKVTILLRFILILSIVADLLGVMLFIGSIFGIIFGVLFFFLYFINGLGRGTIKGSTRKIVRKRVSKWIIRVIFISAEGVPVLGILPFFTIMALVEIALSQRKVKKLVNKLVEIKSKLK